MPTTTPTIRERLSRVFLPFDRRALRDRRAALQALHAESARAWGEKVDAAQAKVDELEAPRKLLEQTKAGARVAAAAARREVEAIDAEGRKHPHACVTALLNYRDSIYSRIHARRLDEFSSESLNALGRALPPVTWFCYDDATNLLTAAEAQARCMELRAALDRALEGKQPEPEPAA